MLSNCTAYIFYHIAFVILENILLKGYHEHPRVSSPYYTTLLNKIYFIFGPILNTAIFLKEITVIFLRLKFETELIVIEADFLNCFSKLLCSNFRPAFGCCARQTLVELVIYSVFAAKNLKKARNL